MCKRTSFTDSTKSFHRLLAEVEIGVFILYTELFFELEDECIHLVLPFFGPPD